MIFLKAKATFLFCLFVCLACAIAETDEKQEVTIPQLVRQLQDTQPDVRAAAAAKLQALGDMAESARPALLRALGDSDERVRFSCAVAIASFWSAGPADSPTVPILSEALKSQDPSKRSTAIGALRELRSRGRRAIPVLVKILKDEGDSLQSVAAAALGSIGPEAKDALSALLDASRDNNPLVCLSAMNALAGLGYEAKAAVPGLHQELIKGEDAKWRVQVARTLWEIDRDTATAVRIFLSVLRSQDSSDDARSDAIFALYMMGADAKDAVTPLTVELRNTDRKNREFAATTLALIGLPAKESVPALIKVLAADEFREVRLIAAAALGEIAAEPQLAIPALIDAVHDPDTLVRERATRALGRFGENARAALPVLHEAAKDASMEVRIEAAEALWRIGRQRDSTLRLLVEALKSDEDYVRYRAARALATVGPEAEPTATALSDAMKDEHGLVRAQAAMALWATTGETRRTVPVLVGILKDEWERDYVREEVIESLGKMGAPAVPSLTEALKDENLWLRKAAAAALGKIGPEAKGAIPELRLMLDEPFETIQRTVTDALTKIDSLTTSAFCEPK